MQYTVQVEQLLPAVDENMLYRIFSACGNITRQKLNKTGKEFNFAHVGYFTKVGADTAVERCNGRNICGAAIRVIKLHNSNGQVPEGIRSVVNSQSFQLASCHVGSDQMTHSFKCANISQNSQSSEPIQVNAVASAQNSQSPQHFGVASVLCAQNSPAQKSQSTEPISTHVLSGQLYQPYRSTIRLNSTSNRPIGTVLSAQGCVMQYTVQVEQLLPAVDENMLYRIFSACGNITHQKLNKTGKEFNFAHVGYFTKVGADTAVERCNGRNICGAAIRVIKLHNSNGQVPDGIRSVVSAQNSQSSQLYTATSPVVSAQMYQHCQPAGSNSQYSQPVNLVESSQSNQLDIPNPFEAAIVGGPTCISVMPTSSVHPASPLPTPKQNAAITSDSSSYIWFWENDQKNYSLYSDEHSKMITEYFLISPKSSFRLDILQCTYMICLDEMTQRNEKSGFKRKIKYKITDQQCTSETATHTKPPSSLNDSNPPSSHSHNTQTAQPVKGQIATQTVQTDPASRHCNRQIHVETEGCKSKCGNAVSDLRTESAPALLDIMDRCCIEAAMVRTDLAIKGAKEYEEYVYRMVQEKCMALVKQIMNPRPDHWDPQTEHDVLIPINILSEEWKDVVTRMHKTLPEAKVTKLQRIQNEWIWKRYAFTKQRMSEKNGESLVNEKYLFHGTGTTPPEKIYKAEQGFDFRYSSDDNLWGTGTYFAVNACYSDRYSYASGNERCMFLAYVLTGETCECKPDRQMRKPPCKPHCKGNFENELYDSVTGHTNGSQIYVIYDNEKSYPAYLITYS